jgi:hypothetical protein
MGKTYVLPQVQPPTQQRMEAIASRFSAGDLEISIGR